MTFLVNFEILMGLVVFWASSLSCSAMPPPPNIGKIISKTFAVYRESRLGISIFLKFDSDWLSCYRFLNNIMFKFVA